MSYICRPGDESSYWNTRIYHLFGKRIKRYWKF